jgi:hypothetical protein
MTEPGDFYEDDEPAEDVLRAFEDGVELVTRQPSGWYCEHYTITASSLAGTPSVGCGCAMLPLPV